PARVRAVIRLGEAEAADGGAGLEGGQPPVLLLVGAVAGDRVHDQTALDGGEGAEPRVAALQLLHDEAVGDVVEAGAAVPLQGGPERPELPELGVERLRERPRPMVLGHDGEELGLYPVAHRVPDHALLLREERVAGVVVDAPELLHGSPALLLRTPPAL